MLIQLDCAVFAGCFGSVGFGSANDALVNHVLLRECHRVGQVNALALAEVVVEFVVKFSRGGLGAVAASGAIAVDVTRVMVTETV
ncbi:hypothetical protein [Candidatus Thiothrix anitrata]|uniref:Uncharacterized protein n=1 Tax=Candidatus Thiothrix anitrata TaxID=2823902 RepID=A0ABX7X599_9GAMM|nr:hypothetical protein [Candidatus Thiothrix anitrata]QTR51050.1 hypothetical protein J8380_05680 [Candidatus Thiothrix anitrata]